MLKTKKLRHGVLFNRKRVISEGLIFGVGGTLLGDCVASEIWVATTLVLILARWKGLSFKKFTEQNLWEQSLSITVMIAR